MTEPGKPRDWDKELAEIDRLIAKQPAQPASPAPASRALPSPPSHPPARPVPSGRRAVLGGWVRVLLGVALVAAMTQWPYPAGCGWRLYLYLGATGAVVLAGLWGMVATWQRRIPLAHVIALGTALWGALLAGRVIVDRTGYVRTPKTWTCPVQP